MARGSSIRTVELWFDPVCVYTWVTSRWLLEVAEQGRAGITWHLMSLDRLNAGTDMGEDGNKEMADSRAAGRLLAAVAREHGEAALGAAYTALGTRYHRGGEPMNRETAAAALTECGADPTLASAIDDAAYDEHVARSHDAGQAALGGTGGSPIVSVDGNAFFGPVLMSIPTGGAATELFDAVAALGRTAAFSQIQRPASGPPEMG